MPLLGNNQSPLLAPGSNFGLGRVQPTREQGLSQLGLMADLSPAGDAIEISKGLMNRDPIGVGLGLGGLLFPGTIAGVRAKMADLDMLKIAESMEGILPMEKIRDATGWFTGKDGKWRFEVDDSAVKTTRREPNFYDEVSGKEYPVYTGKYGSVVSHDKLMQNYPELANTKMRIQAQKPTPTGITRNPSGEYNPDLNYIESRTGPIYASDTAPHLMHETQHAIQNIEGFTPGTSPEYFMSRDSMMGVNGGDPVERYLRTAGEVEAYNVQDRMLMDADYRRMLSPLSTEGIPRNMQTLMRKR